jgi:predicted Rossmann-fold nucleotide-binding protein
MKDVAQPIINNVNLFYDDKMIQAAINNVRDHLIIEGKLSDEVINQISKIDDIDKLVEILIENWINESLKDEIKKNLTM